MLVQYRLSPDARRRQFLEGVVPSESNLLEVDIHALSHEAQRQLRSIARIKTFSDIPVNSDAPVCLTLPGEFDAISLPELLGELARRDAVLRKSRQHDEAHRGHRL
jgi:hypothetical protein